MFGIMSQLLDYQLQVQELVHDLSAIDFTPTELTNWINNARNRVALDFHSVRYLQQNASLITNQEQYPITGGICGITINNPGLYPNGVPPMITISAPLTGGIQATATAVLANNQVSQINMTNYGSLYSPTLAVGVSATFSPPSAGGTLAIGTPLVENNTFDILSMSPLWGTERYMMGWLPFTPFQAFCRANPTLQRQPAVWSSIPESNIFFIYPKPDQPYLADIDMLGLPNPLVNPTDVDTQILPPTNDAVQYYAAHLALLKQQNFPQAEFYEKKYNARVPQLQTTKQDRRIPNVYRNWQRRIARW